ncbi:MAG: HEAT repeat domain-containing protein [Proteobacteria bacterium]|nr:HEAT repeat domain-containing protein [Pseudomonadota bacterium]
MGLLGLFGKKSGASALRKHAERVANKRAQAPDRWESIQALAQMGGADAIAALLPRFTFYVDPSITDQEEKDLAFEAIVGAGEQAVEPVVAFLRRAESISWPLKMLDALVAPDEVIGRLLGLLEGMDIEYERDPQRKIQILAVLEERVDQRVAPVVIRFLQDANETVRFHAAGALLAQEPSGEAKQGLMDCLKREESVRVRVRILDSIIDAGWDLGPSPDLKLPAGYRVDRKGRLQKAS